MNIKKRVIENVEIPSKKQTIVNHLDQNNIYFLSSKSINVKGTKEIINLFGNITYKKKKTQETESEEVNLDHEKLREDSSYVKIPERKKAIEFSNDSGNEEGISFSEEINNESNEIDTDELQISFFVEIEGVIFEVQDYKHYVTFNSFKPLEPIFNQKNVLNYESFVELVTNKANLNDLFYDDEEINDLFKVGNIDLSLNEIFENRNACSIEQITTTSESINIIIKRFEGNQTIHTKFSKDNNRNDIMNYCVSFFANLKEQGNQYELKEKFNELFSLQ